VVIHCERGIPNGAFEPAALEMWFRLSGELDGLFVEHVNSAVIAVYED
jgi:hypothetical protein